MEQEFYYRLDLFNTEYSILPPFRVVIFYINNYLIINFFIFSLKGGSKVQHLGKRRRC